MEDFDIAIIGAGPVGIFTAFQAGMLGMSSVVIDIQHTIGGQCASLYPEKPIYDIPAHSRITGRGLVDALIEQASVFNPTYILGQEVKEVRKDNGEDFVITTSNGVSIRAKAVVIAGGCGAFQHKKPPLKDIESYENKSIFYSINKISDFKGSKIAIAGGGDSAADWAVILAEHASKVYLIHRRDHFRCMEDTLIKIEEYIKKGKIEKVTPYQLHSLEGENGQIKTISVVDFDDNIRVLECDYLLPFFGLSMELGPIATWGLALDKKNISVNPATMETSQQAIYAVGDICTYPGKLKLILTGFAEAAAALHHSYKKVKGHDLHFEYSTTKGAGAHTGSK